MVLRFTRTAAKAVFVSFFAKCSVRGFYLKSWFS